MGDRGKGLLFIGLMWPLFLWGRLCATVIYEFPFVLRLCVCADSKFDLAEVPKLFQVILWVKICVGCLKYVISQGFFLVGLLKLEKILYRVSVDIYLVHMKYVQVESFKF